MSIKEKLQKSIKDFAKNSVGKSSPYNIHEPKVPAVLKAAQEKK